MQKFSIYLEPEQLRKLRIIRSMSLGKPDLAALIRQAIDQFVTDVCSREAPIKAAIEPESKPRLVRHTATAQPSPGKLVEVARDEK